MYLVGESRWIRIATFTSLYFAQGIPIGLLDVAMPAWMAAQDFSNSAIAGFVAVVGLPWGFKLIAGPFMDRFQYPPMGRRRPWVMGAQTGLMLALIGLTVIEDPAIQLTLLTTIGFLVNCFAATQDVAVDGMAIDVVPMNERGKVNAFMGFGQVLGYSAFGALNGVLLTEFGLVPAALVCAVAVAVILLLVTLTRERPGDRYLPRSGDQPQPRMVTVAEGPLDGPFDSSQIPGRPPTFVGILRDLLKVLTLPMSVIIASSILLERMTAGVMVVTIPVFAVKELGFDAAEYSQVYGLMAGTAAFIGLLFGPLIDRYGGKRILMAGMLTSSIVVGVFASTQTHWSDTSYVLSMMFVYLLATQAVFIGIIAQCMNLSWARVAATQFAIYMALSNLGRSIGAGTFSTVADSISYQQSFTIVSIGFMVSFLVLLGFSEARHRSAVEALGT